MDILDYIKFIFVYRAYGWNGLLAPFVFSLSLGLLFFEWPQTRPKQYVLLFCNVAFLYVIRFFVGYFFTFLNYYHISVIAVFTLLSTILPCIFQYLIYLRIKSWYPRLMTMLSFLTCSILSSELTNILGELLGIWDLSLIFTFLFNALTLFICRFASPSKALPKTSVYALVQVALTLSSLIITSSVEIIFNSYNYRKTISGLLFAIIISCYIIASLAYLLFTRWSKDKERELEQQAIFLKRYAEDEMLRLTQVNSEEIKKIRHDLKGQYQMLQYFLANKEYDKLNTYLQEMTKSQYTPLHFVDCGNDVISAILNTEITRASQKDIQITYHFDITSKILISDYDLSHLLFNLLDNAIEAIERENPERRTILLSIALKRNYLFIKLLNSIEKDSTTREQALGTTSKSDKSYHGYGLKIVQEIVRKYDGIYQVDISKGTYHVDVALINEKREAIK